MPKPTEERLRKALTKLIKQCDRVTKGVDRDGEDLRSKHAPGCMSRATPSAAMIRDLMDAAMAGRAALSHLDQEPSDGSR